MDGTIDRISTNRLDESTLMKGQLRKLNALRKSFGRDIEERTLAEWLASRRPATEETDKNAELVVETLWPLVREGRLRFAQAAIWSDADASS